ncbi:hypothetical protein OsI_02691 [Oryza sativa Indica Group]|uniref:Uncharacterized protein n=1 Tax=Oryza sativa subsp. indica TaxID=39946 RepID=B8AB59_ORYSI|nr:hypothetical protein OsI_02691 [Oryza sativa Indica Group]
MVACAVSMGDCGRETMRRWIRLPLCAPCAWIQLWRRGAGGASADPVPPSSRVDPTRMKTMGRRQDGGNLRGGELVLRHPWSSGGHPRRRWHRACLSPSFHLLHRRKERPPPVVSVLNLETTESHLFSIRQIQKEKKAARINNTINQLFFLVLVGRCPDI